MSKNHRQVVLERRHEEPSPSPIDPLGLPGAEPNAGGHGLALVVQDLSGGSPGGPSCVENGATLGNGDKEVVLDPPQPHLFPLLKVSGKTQWSVSLHNAPARN